jgi:hypothetical protein
MCDRLENQIKPSQIFDEDFTFTEKNHDGVALERLTF